MSAARQQRRTSIAVCGSGDADATLVALADEVGRLVVEAGCVLVCGGLGGVMAAAARGGQQARQAGADGLVLGLLPGDSFEEANPFCDLVVPTGLGAARNALVVRAADAVILLGGGSGTLSEAAYAWQFGKPVIALVSSGGWAARLAGQSLDERRPDVIVAAASAQDAVGWALRAVQTEQTAL